MAVNPYRHAGLLHRLWLFTAWHQFQGRQWPITPDAVSPGHLQALTLRPKRAPTMHQTFRNYVKYPEITLWDVRVRIVRTEQPTKPKPKPSHQKQNQFTSETKPTASNNGIHVKTITCHEQNYIKLWKPDRGFRDQNQNYIVNYLQT